VVSLGGMDRSGFFDFKLDFIEFPNSRVKTFFTVGVEEFNFSNYIVSIIKMSWQTTKELNASVGMFMPPKNGFLIALLAKNGIQAGAEA